MSAGTPYGGLKELFCILQARGLSVWDKIQLCSDEIHLPESPSPYGLEVHGLPHPLDPNRKRSARQSKSGHYSYSMATGSLGECWKLVYKLSDET